MRKLLIVAVVGMVLVIAACGPGAEPTSTPTATPRPIVATPTPTPTPGVLATPTPTAKPLATPTATPKPVLATPTPTAAPLATVTATATPKRGGILKVRYNAAPPHYDVYQATADFFTSPVYNNLTAQDPLDPTSEKIVPDLADRWEISGDGLTITLFLHKGIKWSDGIPFTSADVKYSMDLIGNPPTGFVPLRKSLLAAVASISAPDDNTVVLKMARVSQSILAVLSSQYIPIMPRHVREKDPVNAMKTVMVGTGPYLFKKLTPESIAIYERNAGYWKPGLPYLDGIQLIPIADLNAYIAAMYTGQVDCAVTDARTLAKTDVLRIRKEHPELIQGPVATLALQYLALNAKKPPFTDQRVRIAVQDSIDRVNLQETGPYMTIVSGFKFPGTYYALPAEELAKLPGFGPDIGARRTQARQLLKDAGVAAGTEITLSTKNNKAPQVEVVELMQLQLQAALPSLNVKIRNYSSAEFDSLDSQGGLQVSYENMSFAGMDPDNFGLAYTTGGSRNYYGLSDPRIDELYLKQGTILDPAQRRLVVWEMEKLVIQQGVLVPLWWRADVCLAGTYVKNQICASDQHGSTMKFEIAWLDK